MRRFLILCLTLASTAAAETTTIELTLDEPYEFRTELIAVPFEAGRHFTEIRSVSIRAIGTVGSHARWTCLGAAEWEIQLAGAYVAAGFTEGLASGMLRPFIVPDSDGYGGVGAQPREDLEYDQTFVFDVHPQEGLAWDWGFLEDGRAELLIGSFEPFLGCVPYNASNPCLEYDPCGPHGFTIANYWGLNFGLTRVEVTIESDSAVRGAPSSFGAVKGLYGDGTR